ncbi:hypothetical protein SERLA73DRAFT_84054 [Serpula lacrymans var. lacrymans S7.3]|uniref:Multidrug resistance-associated ABC transporter n=1 Tax=Serpula lacrymans var. lacrymans (strain S7.3) TaxID=936435 RepID=F8PKS1_SERL3|nr:hypothetical protein SERLA73DRAFT_84054 [Serpula lacrymans var. lacrymans S7.3]
MLQYQLPVAVALASTAVGSFIVFLYLAYPREGKIQLPIHGEETEQTIDPFDVTKPEDVIEGYPIDEDAFWIRMRLWKLFLTIILAIILAIQTICLAWSAINDDRDALIVYALHAAFSLYTVIVVARSINQDNAEYHSESLIHLAALTFVPSALLAITAILPYTKPDRVLILVDPALKGLWYAVLALYLVACIISWTLPSGPHLHFPAERIYSEKTIKATTNFAQHNVCGLASASVLDFLMFNYTTKVVMLGNISSSLEIGDLPILPANMRATHLYSAMKHTVRSVRLRVGNWRPRVGSGFELAYRLVCVNWFALMAEVVLAAVSAVLFYTPPLFLEQLVLYLESDPTRENPGWGLVYATGIFFSNVIVFLITAQLWSLTTTTIQVRVRIQLNTILFAKTLVRKDIASSSAVKSSDDKAGKDDAKESDDDDDFSSKAQIMTLMTTDVDRVSEFSWHMFSLIDSPIEIVIGTLFLYKLLGSSCFIGLGVTCLFLPMNHYAGKVVVRAQENLMKARDERVALMNEILGGIRMLKFMAWERSFEKRVLKIRERELKFQKLNYTIEVLFNAIWYKDASPVLVTIVSFWHFSVIRGNTLTPSIAFTSILIFAEMKFALNALPETFINMLQSFVSLRRIEKYLHGAEVTSVAPLSEQPSTITLQSATITWPQDRTSGSATSSAASSVAPTPRQKFVLVDLSISFPPGELSLISGKLGSGKTLLLLALLGEADLLTGQIICPRSPPDSLASFTDKLVSKEEWVVPGVCAYVPQAAWLRNASIKDNILFNLPLDEERYQKTLQVCALVSDLNILEDGDESEIGERGVNLSGGQKARVSLARAVYSRASVLLLDDVLSAVDAHTAHHLYHECLKGELMQGRTVILVSHHVQLCAPGASYIVALDNGRVIYQGDHEKFQNSSVMNTLIQSTATEAVDDQGGAGALEIEEISPTGDDESTNSHSGTESTAVTTEEAKPELAKKAPRKLIEEEKRAVGHISRDIWETYIHACGQYWYWACFALIMILGALSPVAENWWLKTWSGTSPEEAIEKGPMYYISIYAIVTVIGLIVSTARFYVLYNGSIRASNVLYKRLLETVLFANIRFHDTISRGRLLNRFGKDFEGIDSRMSDNFGRGVIYGLNAFTTIVTISMVGGLPFLVVAAMLAYIYFNVAKVFSQTARDMRRLDSVTRSPLYSIYGETISGVTILRAFGGSSKFLRDMLQCVDTNSNPYYWMWGVNRWLSARYDIISSAVVGLTAFVAVFTPSISAALAGFALAFASTITGNLLFLVRRFVGLEQSMVALERVKEYSELKREPPEFIEPRPPSSWPENGAITCDNLVIRYAPELPNVLHNINFNIHPGEKVGILGRTGSGKSTLALSFFRFVEATEGRILVDGLDISQIGLTDLRSKLTIIPQDPTILSGTLRSTLDVFDEYQDAEIFEALRRVHLIPSEDTPSEATDTVNANVFRSLDSSVSEGGENFSTGEKQLLCMARAILKRSKVLVMDEATASVDYATDELISKTIRHEFASSTILTIAHRLRTVIDYDRVMLLDEGRIVEFDRPGTLLADSSSGFHGLCKATGKNEFAMLKQMAGL